MERAIIVAMPQAVAISVHQVVSAARNAELLIRRKRGFANNVGQGLFLLLAVPVAV